MKIVLYPKSILEAAWEKDRRQFSPDAAVPPKCLRCGQPLDAHLPVNALSRYADVHICESCGIDEALRDASHIPLPLEEWDAIKQGRLQGIIKGHICHLVTSCFFEQVFHQTHKPPMQFIERPDSEVVYSRSDYDGYRWWTTWHNKNGKKAEPEQVKEIDEFYLALFELPAFKTLDTLKHFCRYAQATSDPTEFNLYSETEHFFIWIRIITRFRDYNVYIHYYDKDISDKARPD